MSESSHGVSFQRKTLQVIGYFYEKWPHGKRQELYRLPVTKEEYQSVVRRIKRGGGSEQQKDQALFNHFKQKLAQLHEAALADDEATAI